jgi:hypothetical protein
MGVSKLSSPSELEEARYIGLGEEEKSNVQNLIKAASDVTAALFALYLIKESNTPRAESISKASKLLSEAAEELKKALRSPHP